MKVTIVDETEVVENTVFYRGLYLDINKVDSNDVATTAKYSTPYEARSKVPHTIAVLKFEEE